MMALKLITTSKINLFLDVINKREDNYHNIQSLFLEISIGDNIQFDINKKYNGIFIESNIEKLAGKNNIIYKVWESLENRLINKKGLKVKLKKVIPLGSGLGGGSADAVYSLNTIDKLYNLKLSNKEKFKICNKLGADLPFFLKGGLQIGEGKGEILKKIDCKDSINIKSKLKILIVCPEILISTVESYKSLNIKACYKSIESRKEINLTRINSIINGIKNNNIKKIEENLYNKFEDDAFSKYPILKEIKADLIEYKAFASLMSGSGSAIFGLFTDDILLNYAYNKMIKKSFICFKALPLI